jgi:plastocyanin
MKKTIILFLFLTVITGISFPTTYTITNSGFTFTPDNISISLGDTIKFVLGSIHDAVEVDKATWDANGTTSNGGFNIPFGGGILVLTQPGTYYYVCTNHASLGMKGIIVVNPATYVKPVSGVIPENFILKQNYPNPFNPATTIEFTVPHPGFVTLKVYNNLGEKVAVLINGILPEGKFDVEWNAQNFESGIYFYRIVIHSDRLQQNNFTETKKMILLK